MRRALFFVVLLAPAMVWSQSQQPQGSRFDLTLTVGYRMGGDIRIEERAVRPGDYVTDLASSGALGLRLGYALSDTFRLEFIGDRQGTRLMDNQGLFGEEPGSFVPPGNTSILDVTLTNYHLGLTWDLTTGPSRWYLAGSVGVTDIRWNLPLPNDRPISASLGGGVRLEMSPRLWILFEARGFWVNTDEGLHGTVEFENEDCGETCYITFRYDNSIVQSELTVGLFIRF
ncbi:MAG: hypothetical protein ACC742_12705 [Thermoanaerobaculales bacterium]